MIQKLLFPDSNAAPKEFDPAKTNMTVQTLIDKYSQEEAESFEQSHANLTDMTSTKTSAFKRSNQAKRDKKQQEKETLDGWYGMKKQEMTKEKENELTLMKLRRYLSSTSFFKRDEVIGLPKYFEIGEEIPSGMREKNRKKARGTMFDQLMELDQEKKFTKRKFREIQEDKAKRFKNRRFIKLKRALLKGKKKLKKH